MAYDNSNNQHSFSFLHPLLTLSKSPLVFLAESASTTDNVLVKVFKGNYSVQVHQTLATAALAPQLYGSVSPDGLPVAYVMEYLPPASSTNGWMTLHDFSKGKRISQGRFPDLIWASLDHILHVLSDDDMVHGDLRPNNIMIYVDSNGVPAVSDERVVLKVLDFDWAGSKGEARYPVVRNEALNWPGKPNELIVPEMDLQLVTG